MLFRPIKQAGGHICSQRSWTNPKPGRVDDRVCGDSVATEPHPLLWPLLFSLVLASGSGTFLSELQEVSFLSSGVRFLWNVTARILEQLQKDIHGLPAPRSKRDTNGGLQSGASRSERPQAPSLAAWPY